LKLYKKSSTKKIRKTFLTQDYFAESFGGITGVTTFF